MYCDRITHAVILTPVEARQGVISGRGQLALAVSLTMVIVAFVVVYVVGVSRGRLKPAGASTSAQS